MTGEFAIRPPARATRRIYCGRSPQRYSDVVGTRPVLPLLRHKIAHNGPHTGTLCVGNDNPSPRVDPHAELSVTEHCARHCSSGETSPTAWHIFAGIRVYGRHVSVD